MALPLPSWTLDDGTTAATPWTFTGLAPSAPSAWQTRYLWNNRGGTSPVDPILEGKLRVLARIQGDTVWQAAGLVALDTRSIEVEILGGSAGSGIEARSPVRIGAGAWLDLPEIPDGEAVHLRARVSLPGTAGETSLELDFYPDLSPAEALPTGVWESAGGGVRLGIGDGAVTRLLAGAAPAASGPPDDVVTVPDVKWVHLGVPRVTLEHEVTLDDTDGAAATLGAGEAYYALFSLGGTDVTLTKGLKDTLPLDQTNRPATPAGELPYALVTVDDSGTIEQADIALLTEPWGFPVSADGLNALAGPGEALVGGRFVRNMTPSQETVAASDTSIVYLMPDGSLESTVDGSRPADRALALAEVTSDATDITAITDLRGFIDSRAVRVPFFFPDPAANDVLFWANAGLTPLYVRPIRPILCTLIDDPSVLAAVSGAWVVDLQLLQTDWTWLTLFTSHATDDRRPTIPFDTTTGRDVSALPEQTVIPPGGVLRCKVVQIPSGGTPASGLIASLMLETPLG